MIMIYGKIKGKARPRFFNGHAVTPKDTVDYENFVRLCYKQQDSRKLEGAIRVVITAYYKIPNCYSKKRIQAIREGREYPCKTPDCDNIAKIILDSLNGIAYEDDKQVTELTVLKRWTEGNERVEFEIEEVN